MCGNHIMLPPLLKRTRMRCWCPNLILVELSLLERLLGLVLVISILTCLVLVLQQ